VRTAVLSNTSYLSNAPPFRALSAAMAPSAADPWSQARAAWRCAAARAAASPCLLAS
jgi:hypothetical protein